MKAPIVVLLHGPAQSGRDTAASYLEAHYGFARESFAKPLKRLVTATFGVPYPDLFDPAAKESPLPEPWSEWTPRKLMQFIGTDVMRRHFDTEIWVKSCVARMLRSSHKRWVIGDARFPNELAIGKWLPGWRVESVGIWRDHTPSVGIAGHLTETRLETAHNIDNNGTLDALYAQVAELMHLLDIRRKD